MTTTPVIANVMAELLRLTEAQAAAAEAGDWSRFDALLTDRERVLASPGLVAALSRADARVRAEATATLGRIEALDAANYEVLARERRLVLDELPAVEAGRRAAAAYRTPVVTTAYVDASS